MLHKKTSLTRKVKGRVRFYEIECTNNLFEEWLIIRRYGSSKQCMRTIMEVFETSHKAAKRFETLCKYKYAKGYRPI